MASADRARAAGGSAVILGLLVLWQASIGLGVVHFDYLPTPVEVGGALLHEGRSGTLAQAILHTTWAALVAWLIALAVGGLLGIALGLSARARSWGMTSVDVLRTLPVIAFIPIAALLFGLSTMTEIAVAAWSATWPVVVNTLGAVRSVHPRLNEVAKVLHLTRRRRLTAVILPAATPLALVGARLALGLALVVTVAAEMIANPEGVGYQIVLMQQALRPDAMFAYILVVGMLGWALNAALQTSSDRLAPHAGPRRAA